MPERTRRKQPDKKAPQQPRSQSKPPDHVEEFEVQGAEHTSFDNVMQTDAAATQGLSPRQMIHLQRTIGNHATRQLIQRTQAPAIVAKTAHLRTSAELDAASRSHGASDSGSRRLVQRAEQEAEVADDTQVRAPSSSNFDGDASMESFSKGQDIVIDDTARDSEVGPDGNKGGSHQWYKIIKVNGTAPAGNLWIHGGAVKKKAVPPKPTPPIIFGPSSIPRVYGPPQGSGRIHFGAGASPSAFTPAKSRVDAPTPTPSSPSSDIPLPVTPLELQSMPPERAPSPAPAPAPKPPGYEKPTVSSVDTSGPAESGPTNPDGTPAWLRGSGESSVFNEKMTRAKYQYAGYNAVKTGLRTNYLATDGAEEFDPEAYKHSTDVVSPSGLRHEVHEGASAVRSGVRDVVSDVRGGGGSGGGEHSGVASQVSGEASSVLGSAKEFAATTAKDANKGDWIGWLQRALGSVLGVVSKFSPFVMLAKSIVGVIDKIIDYNALKDGFASMDAKNKAGRLAGTEDKVYKTTKYAVAKVKRGMFERLAFFVGDLAKVIVHLITLLSGGTTFMVTEAIAVSISLAQGAKKLANGAKGAFKYLTGTRGKNRAKNAKVLVDAAFERQPEALTILRELNPFPLAEKWKMRAETAKNATVNGMVSGVDAMGRGMGGAMGIDVGEALPDERSSVYPQNNDEMYTKLLAFITGPKGAENRATLEKNVSSKLKSS